MLEPKDPDDDEADAVKPTTAYKMIEPGDPDDDEEDAVTTKADKMIEPGDADDDKADAVKPTTYKMIEPGDPDDDMWYVVLVECVKSKGICYSTKITKSGFLTCGYDTCKMGRSDSHY